MAEEVSVVALIMITAVEPEDPEAQMPYLTLVESASSILKLLALRQLVVFTTNEGDQQAMFLETFSYQPKCLALVPGLRCSIFHL